MLSMLKIFSLDFEHAWLTATYGGEPSEDNYVEIMSHDEHHDYFLFPTVPSPDELRALVMVDEPRASSSSSNQALPLDDEEED